MTRGSLTPEEFDEIRRPRYPHVSLSLKDPLGQDVFASRCDRGRSPPNGSMAPATPIALHAEEIPVQSKMMTISDIFDALNRQRPPLQARRSSGESAANSGLRGEGRPRRQRIGAHLPPLRQALRTDDGRTCTELRPEVHGSDGRCEFECDQYAAECSRRGWRQALPLHLRPAQWEPVRHANLQRRCGAA